MTEFSMMLPVEARYELAVLSECDDDTTLLSPPNFDPDDVDSRGFFLLPDADPDGLYARKAEPAKPLFV